MAGRNLHIYTAIGGRIEGGQIVNFNGNASKLWLYTKLRVVDVKSDKRLGDVAVVQHASILVVGLKHTIIEQFLRVFDDLMNQIGTELLNLFTLSPEAMYFSSQLLSHYRLARIFSAVATDVAM